MIRVQPFKKATWDHYCYLHWLTLCMAVVQDADQAGVLDKLSPETPVDAPADVDVTSVTI